MPDHRPASDSSVLRLPLPRSRATSAARPRTRPAACCRESPSRQGARLQGAKTATTAGDGTYRISLVPPGEYTVSFSLAGFGKVEKKVTSSSTRASWSTLRSRWPPRRPSPSRERRRSSTPRRPRRGRTSRPRWSRRCPSDAASRPSPRRLPASSRVSARTAATSTVQGATGAENNFLIDGVDTTEVQYGRQGKAAPSEFIQEIEVKAGGFQAEYGHCAGRRPERHHEVRRKHLPRRRIRLLHRPAEHGRRRQLLAGRGRPHPGQGRQPRHQPLDDRLIRNTLRADYGADLGGYAWKDRIWFFGAYDRVHTGGQNFLNNPTGNCTSDRATRDRAREP